MAACHSASFVFYNTCFLGHVSGDNIKQKLHYFTQVEHLSQRLNSPTMSVNSETFFSVLAKIDECLDYMRTNVSFTIRLKIVLFNYI